MNGEGDSGGEAADEEETEESETEEDLFSSPARRTRSNSLLVNPSCLSIDSAGNVIFFSKTSLSEHHPDRSVDICINHNFTVLSGPRILKLTSYYSPHSIPIAFFTFSNPL